MNPMDFLDEFQAEANEKLDAIASQLLRLERDASNPQPVREMFLAAHTIKGGAAMLRLTAVETLAHALEDLLSAFRDQERTLTSATADLLFQTLDHLRALIASADPEAVGAEVDPSIEAFAARLRRGESETPAAPAPTAAPTVPRRALVVDDSATLRALHKLLLEDAGFAVETAEQAVQALELASQGTFDVVVAGLELRGMNGFDLTRALRGLPGYGQVPIVLLSADADTRRAQQAADAGATSLVRKGHVDDAALSAALRDPLQRAA